MVAPGGEYSVARDTWTPAPAKDPREGMGFLKRFWVEILHPEQLRRQVS